MATTSQDRTSGCFVTEHKYEFQRLNPSAMHIT